MDSTVYEQYFLQPQDPWHRRYEALRALFVEQQSLPEVAERFSVSYRTVANWASAFRCQWEANILPPFSLSPLGDGPAHRSALLRLIPPPLPRRMSELYRC